MILFYSSDKDGRRINGVDFLVNELLLPHVKHFGPVSNRICYMRIADKYGDLILICVYAPTETGSNDEKEMFFEELERLYDKLPNHCIKIFLGDFNAQVGNDIMYKPWVRGESAHYISNGNGMRLIEYAIAKDLIITSNFFPRKLYKIHKVDKIYKHT
ncbi:PREDICTED: craniofacial development protein 2-like [Diuraphis noxia]|uniref:craniofacial development protein 2-like n=1 Tax=Diuraphis noxia TaxID=143948 RepID=UPI0007636AA6|nr:PREDICTED: craniofacial development protein 2-like [Diuraphis noxia]